MTTLELKGIGHELKFWKGFVQTERFLKQWVGDEVTAELAEGQPEVVRFIKDHLTAASRVLDLGSGVVSILNGLVPKEQLVTTDPLGELYECIFDYAGTGIAPPLPLPAEELPEYWNGQFDIVHMRNALDHTQNPHLALARLTNCCKRDGLVIVHGFCNEATAENWQGFHQWNIRLDENGELIIANKESEDRITSTKKISLTKKLPGGKEWFVWIHENNEWLVAESARYELKKKSNG